MRLLATLAVCLLVGACSSVAPWERGRLASEHMAFDPDPQARRIHDLTYASKEAASGGGGIGGGGCGCN